MLPFLESRKIPTVSLKQGGGGGREGEDCGIKVKDIQEEKDSLLSTLAPHFC